MKCDCLIIFPQFYVEVRDISKYFRESVDLEITIKKFQANVYKKGNVAFQLYIVIDCFSSCSLAFGNIYSAIKCILSLIRYTLK